MSGLFLGLQLVHGHVRWLIVLLGLIVLIKSAVGWLGKQDYQSIDRSLMSWFSMLLSAQLVLGLVVLFGKFATVYGDDSSLKGQAIGHAIVMIIAIFTSIIGGVRAKKAYADGDKFRLQTIVLLVVAVLIFVGVLSVPKGWAF